MLTIKDIFLSDNKGYISSKLVDDKGDICRINNERCILESYDLKSSEHIYRKISDLAVDQSSLIQNGMAISLNHIIQEDRGVFRCRIIDKEGNVISETTKYIGEKIKISVESEEAVVDNKTGIIYTFRSDVELAEDIIEYKVRGGSDRDFKFLIGSRLHKNVPLKIFIASSSRVRFNINESILNVSKDSFVITQ